LETIELESWN